MALPAVLQSMLVRCVPSHECCGNILLVDDHGHTLLTVRSSGTVEPERCGIVDHDGIGGDLELLGAGSRGHGARVDTGDAAVGLVDRSADTVEVGLSDGVCASPELELNHVARSGLDLLRPVLETGDIVDRVPADVDNVDVNG